VEFLQNGPQPTYAAEPEASHAAVEGLAVPALGSV
jgi:hypothetical protein